MTQEKELKASNGYIMLFVFLILFFGSIIGFIVLSNARFILGIIIALFILPGLILVNPNGSRVLLLFGDYKGTVKQNGLFWVNPFYTKKKISLRARNFDSERLKVNDKLGNPVMISTILVWRVRDTYKASFDISQLTGSITLKK